MVVRRVLFLTLFSLLLNISVFGQQSTATQTLTKKQWEDLVTALDKEDWITAADYTAKYLKQFKEEDQEHSLARLRYMFIFASAGKVTRNAMTYPQLEAALKDFVGKEVMTPFRRIDTCDKGPGGLGVACVRGNRVSGAASNRAGTYIHAFEYADLQEKFDATQHKNGFAAVRGLVSGFQFNPNESTLWIMRLHLEKATLEFDQ